MRWGHPEHLVSPDCTESQAFKALLGFRDNLDQKERKVTMETLARLGLWDHPAFQDLQVILV